MALNKAQLMVPPGGPGVTGAVKQAAGSAVTISDGVASKSVTGVAKLLQGANILLTPATGIGDVTIEIVQPALTAAGDDFDPGNKVAFLQAAAPAGWTKLTSFDNGAFRVVSGSGGGTGGTVNFTDGMISYQVTGNVDATVQWGGQTGETSLTPSGSLSINLATGSASLNEGQMGSHQHDGTAIFNDSGQYGAQRKTGGSINFGITLNTSGTGGNQSHLHDVQGTCSLTGQSVSHSHGISASTQESSSLLNGNSKNFGVKYVDMILCQKN